MKRICKGFGVGFYSSHPGTIAEDGSFLFTLCESLEDLCLCFNSFPLHLYRRDQKRGSETDGRQENITGESKQSRLISPLFPGQSR